MTGQGRCYWIDGYNVIFRLGLGRGADLEHQRNELVGRVAAMGRPAWIVFDSQETVVAPGTKGRFRHVQVLYTKKGQTADDVIVARARRTRDPAQVIVVTDDQEVARSCRLAGATIMDVARFGKLLRPLPDPSPKGSRPLSASEIEDWKRYFGVDEEE